MGLGGLLYFRTEASLATSGVIFRPARLAVIPFKNLRFLASAALRQGGDFGMVPPI